MASIAGFTIMGVAPILFQHGADISYPIKEGTSFSLKMKKSDILKLI